VNLEKLGTIIHNKREEVGISLTKAAQKAGIGRSTLWILESGKNPKTGKPSRPSKDILERLAGALHMSQDELEEALSLADYKVGTQPAQTSNQVPPALQKGTTQKLPPSPAATITEINGTVYLVNDGYLQAFDAKSGVRLWSSPTDAFPLETLITEQTGKSELSSLQNAIERIQEEIEDLREHLPLIIERKFNKLDAKLNKDRQGAREHAPTERRAPARKTQKEPAMT
jgi:transcriptional regulator with XRE-family HTH domain